MGRVKYEHRLRLANGYNSKMFYFTPTDIVPSPMRSMTIWYHHCKWIAQNEAYMFFVFLLVAIIVIVVQDYLAMLRVRAMPEGPEKDAALAEREHYANLPDNEC